MRKTVRDDLGHDVTLGSLPGRIVCLCPSLTETLFALGAGERMVGRTRYCIHPATEVQRVARVGGTNDVDIDQIRALSPDLVIAAKDENPRQVVESLTQSTPVFVCDVMDYESALHAIRSLGNLVDRTERAAALVRDIRHAFAGLQPRIRHRVAYLIWRDPYMAVGGSTYIDALLHKCGLDNVCRDLPGRYPGLSIEALRRLAPAYVFLSSEPFSFDDSHVAELTDQLRNARVIRVDGEVFAWYGSRMLAAADYLERLIAHVEMDSSSPEA